MGIWQGLPPRCSELWAVVAVRASAAKDTAKTVVYGRLRARSFNRPIDRL